MKATPQVKGTHIVFAREWIDERLGAGTLLELLRKHAPDYPDHALPGAWYDLRPLVRAFEDVAVQLDSSLEEVVAEVATINAQRDLKTILRAFLWVARPVMLLNSVDRLWRAYVSLAEARATHNEKGHFIGEGHGLPADLLDWAAGAWRGFLPPAIEAAGGKNARASIVARGSDPDDELAWLRCEVFYE